MSTMAFMVPIHNINTNLIKFDTWRITCNARYSKFITFSVSSAVGFSFLPATSSGAFWLCFSYSWTFAFPLRQSSWFTTVWVGEAISSDTAKCITSTKSSETTSSWAERRSALKLFKAGSQYLIGQFDVLNALRYAESGNEIYMYRPNAFLSYFEDM